jgi:hypothetical protein
MAMIRGMTQQQSLQAWLPVPVGSNWFEPQGTLAPVNRVTSCTNAGQAESGARKIDSDPLLHTAALATTQVKDPRRCWAMVKVPGITLSKSVTQLTLMSASAKRRSREETHRSLSPTIF